ncbi:hypothetical protein HDK77DRAFT_449970 [Phyllosticta capitalensis]
MQRARGGWWVQRAIASRVECEHRVRFSFTSSVARILDYIASLDSAATTAAVSLTLFHLQRQRRPCTPSSPDDFLLFLPLQPPPIASPLFSPPTAVCFLFSFDAPRLSATKSCTMDALTDLDAVPIFHQVLYEKEALKLKEGQSEDALDLALRNAALAAGVETRDLELPDSFPDIARTINSPLRRSSVSANTQTSCSTDITTPESLGSTDDPDRTALPVLPGRTSLSTLPTFLPSTRSSSTAASIRSLKSKFMRHTHSFARKKYSQDDGSLHTAQQRSTVHRFGQVQGRLTYKPSSDKGSRHSIAEFDVKSLAFVAQSRPSSSAGSSASNQQSTPNRPSPVTTEGQRAALKLAMENETFREMWHEHIKSFERIAIYEVKQRNLLAFYEKYSRKTLARQWDGIREHAMAQHSQECQLLEDKQLKSDVAMIESQNQERLNSEVALKHMKAYCNTAPIPGGPKKRVVTDEDRQRLKDQERNHESLNRKHETSRMLSRAKQEKELRELKLVQQQQWQELEAHSATARAALNEILQKLSTRLEDLIRQRRIRAVSRWYVSLKLWDRTTTENDDIPPPEDIPSVPWPDSSTAETLAARSSSILDTYITFNNLPPAVSLSPPTITRPQAEASA